MRRAHSSTEIQRMILFSEGPRVTLGGYLIYVDIEIIVLISSGLDSSSPTKNNSKTIERDQLVLSEVLRYHRRVVYPRYPF